MIIKMPMEDKVKIGRGIIGMIIRVRESAEYTLLVVAMVNKFIIIEPVKLGKAIPKAVYTAWGVDVAEI